MMIRLMVAIILAATLAPAASAGLILISAEFNLTNSTPLVGSISGLEFGPVAVPHFDIATGDQVRFTFTFSAGQSLTVGDVNTGSGFVEFLQVLFDGDPQGVGFRAVSGSLKLNVVSGHAVSDSIFSYSNSSGGSAFAHSTDFGYPSSGITTSFVEFSGGTFLFDVTNVNSSDGLASGDRVSFRAFGDPVTVNTTAVPEPSMFVTWGFVGLLCGWANRRTKRFPLPPTLSF